MNTLYFTYKSNKRVVMFEAKVYTMFGDKLLIEYHTILDGVHVNAFEPREIMSSSKEAAFRLQVASDLFKHITKLEYVKTEKKGKKKSWLKLIA